MPTGANSSLVVLSNRLPITLRRERGALRAEASSGGLVSALRPALQRQGGTWIGVNERGVVTCLLNNYLPAARSGAD